MTLGCVPVFPPIVSIGAQLLSPDNTFMNLLNNISICDKSEKFHTSQPNDNTDNTSLSNKPSAKSTKMKNFLILDNSA